MATRAGPWFRRGYGGPCPHPLKGLGRLSSKSNSLKEDIEGRKPVKTLAGSVVDQIQDPVKLLLRYVQKVTTLGKKRSSPLIAAFLSISSQLTADG